MEIWNLQRGDTVESLKIQEMTLLMANVIM